MGTRAARIAALALVALGSFAPRAVYAAGDDEPEIPIGVLDQAPAPTAPAPRAPSVPARQTFAGKFFAEDAFTGGAPAQTVPVPYPAGDVTWANRSSFDASLRWTPWKGITLTLSDRLNVLEQSNLAFASAQTVRNDSREGFVTWEPAKSTFLELGRINVRNGSALGYNPTDFFKTRTLVGQASLDPSVIRQNRLGTLMARAQTIWSGGSASIAFAPQVANASPIDEANPLGLDPRFDATNGTNRLLCTLNLDFADLSPQLLGYFELHRSKVGLNLSRPIGDAVVAYAEWAAGEETNLTARAVAFGQSTGTLPARAPVVPQASGSNAVRNDVAAGFSWTIATKVTVNVEYHFHESGFTRADWQHWFDLGSARGAPAPLTGELWYVRGYANDQQEPVPMHEAFIRASWPNAFVKELELSSFALVDLLDGSMLTQLSASYYLSDAWTVSVFGSVNVGDARSERGSLPQRASGILQLTRYL